MSSNNLTYSYDELINKSEGIRNFARTMGTQLDNITATAEELNNNYRSEYASKVVEAIKKVEEDGESFREAIEHFAMAIHDEIAPTYKKIEEDLKNSTEATYE